MSLIEKLHLYSKRQGGTLPKYDLLETDNLLLSHSISVDLRGYVLPSEISLFSQIKLSNVITLRRDEINITEIEVNRKRLEVQSV